LLTSEIDAREPVADGPEPCPRCGGEQIAGALTLPVLGGARFAYDLGGKMIETEVGATMCERCGWISLRAGNPEPIRRAHTAVRRAKLGRH
jgi:hypothetical protein